ncbi:MAG TPA: universal stress protein [Candidatus Binataceae bacterium]|nr:universal stress protein [Candidatus Binataceae bacterium]
MSLPFRKVLCAIDFGSTTPMTVEMAREIAEANRGNVIFFHVVPMAVEAMGQPLMVEPLTGAEEDARLRLEHLATESHALSYEIQVLTGDPAASIIAAARENGADLIVMATHGRTGLSHFILGSVAERVVRESTVPVITVRAPMRKHRLISESVLLG